MRRLKKLLSLIISTALLVTTIPINSFSVSYPVLPQYEFSNFAKITSANFCNGSDTTIINIQDLHNNKEVQDNICKLLESLNKQFENLEVYIEGASSSIDYNKLFSPMGKTNLSALMNSLYDNDKISGAEYFGYKNNKILNPIEQKKLYDTNIQNYSFLIKNKQQISELLYDKYLNIKSLDTYLLKEQRKLLKFYNLYLNKKVSSEKFYRKILLELNKRKISTLKYINTKLYIDVLNASKKINQKLAEQQLQIVLSNLKSSITYQEYVNLLSDSKNLSDINVIFSYLSANTSNVDKYTKYPDLFRLINLRELSSLINPLDLVEEERGMLEDILLSYSKTSENKEIVFISLFFQIYKKLLLANISSNEYIYYKQNYSNFIRLYSKYLQNDIFDDLYRYVRIAENFNELNLKRNTSFVNSITPNKQVSNKENNNFRGKFYNINKVLSGLDKTKTIKVIISGGFHTQGINELLKQKQVSYITLTPNITDTDKKYEQDYLDSIVEQAELDANAISKRPFLEQQAPIIVDSIVTSLDSIMSYLENYLHQDKKSCFKAIESIMNTVFSANSVQDFISFNFNSEGQAIINIEGKVYELSYDKGKVEIKKDTTTLLAKNIKLLIKEALKTPSIRSILSLNDEYNKKIIPKGKGKSIANQIAERYLMEQNILLPWFAATVMRAIITIDSSDDDIKDSREYKILQNVIKEQNMNLGEEYSEINEQDYTIKIGDSPLLVGAKHDGYGNVEEYGSLFYVVWEKNKNDVDIIKEIFVSNELFSYLKSFDEKKVRSFFKNLIIHERLEMVAVTGKSKRYNSHYKDFARTSEGFHKYIREGIDFGDFIEEQRMSQKNVERQRDLLNELDGIISGINEQNSEYSGIVSLVSKQEGADYSNDDIEKFLAVRIGDEKTIYDSNMELADKICKQLKQEYDLANHETFDAKKFVDFINNNYAFVYKKSNEYLQFDKLPNLVKTLLKQKYFKLWNNNVVDEILIDNINILIEEIDDEKISLKQKKNISGKKIFFVEDIISRKSKTYNKIYNKLISYGAGKVQAFVFFDLSKEPKGSNMITDATYTTILRNPKLLFDLISKTKGKVKKYVVYWLAKLLQDNDGINVLKEISKMDNEIKKNLIDELFAILKRGDKIIDVDYSQIVELILFIGFGNKKNIFEIEKQDLDNIITQYDIKKIDKTESKPLEVVYDEWKNNIPTLLIYSYLCGYNYIDANGINNLLEKTLKGMTNKKLIEKFGKNFNISLIDKKTKLKHLQPLQQEIGQTEELKRNGRENLEKAKYIFEQKTSSLNKQYNQNKISHEKFLEEIKKIEDEYRDSVKQAMIVAKNIVLEKLREDGIYMNDSMFAIIIGGSLSKGNVTSDSEIYYDIIVKNGIISKSIEQYFTPLYSSLLRDFGLVNYQVFKYSTTSLDKKNINTFVDEKEEAPFLNYELLEKGNPECIRLYDEYMQSILESALKLEGKFRKGTIKNLNFISKVYYYLSKFGKGWVGKSFYSIYDLKDEKNFEGKIFTTKWSLMTFESVLNKIIFQYIEEMSNKNAWRFGNIPISVHEQVDFINTSIFTNNKGAQKQLNTAFKSWEFLSACRYENNNIWTEISEQKKIAIKNINEFAETYLDDKKSKTFIRKEAENPREYLEIIEEFVYDNSTDSQIFRNGYEKYSHLDEWKKYSVGSDEDLFIKAQAIVLLLDMGDLDTIKSKLKNLNIPGLKEKYLPSLFKSLDTIKMIDEKFKDFSNIDGERSLQNYWDLVAKMTGNETTLLALIAHKLTNAKYPNPNLYNNEEEYEKLKENNILLVHSIYLPLSKRFGNSQIYEYVRNDLFESSSPQEYLNLLNIIETLYGAPYTQFYEINENIKLQVEKYFTEKKVLQNSFVVKFRPKTLYSIHEKLNSERRKDEIIREVGNTEKGLVKFILNSQEPLFKNILNESLLDNTLINDKEKKFILEHIDNDYASLSPKQKEFIDNLIYTTRQTIFSDYKLVNYIKANFNRLPRYLMDNLTGLRNMEVLKKYLEDNSMWLELYFVELFTKELKDLLGLHVVIKDEVYDKFISDDTVTELRDFFGSQGLKFDKFDKDKKDKQARLKISALEKSLPIEMCFYKKTDYEEEIYGFYNLETLSSPHYQYKTGRKIQIYPEIEKLTKELKELEETEFKNDKEKQEIEKQIDSIRTQIKKFMGLVFFDGTYIHEMNLSFAVKTKQNKKQFVFIPDEYKPTDNLEENRSQIVKSKELEEKTIFFVEYEDCDYILDLSKEATVYDLINSKYFADDEAVSVYDEEGEPLGLDVKLEDARTYKVIKNISSMKIPSLDAEEMESASTRTKLHQAITSEKEIKSNIINFFETIGNKSDVSEVVALLLFDEKKNILLDERKLNIEELVSLLYNENSTNTILKSKENLNNFFNIIFNLIETYGLKDIMPSTFIKRSTMIANHYNLSNMFELFEAIDYAVISFNDISKYYKTCIFIKNKSENITEESILNLISDKINDGTITEINTRKNPNANYNLIINDKKYYVDYNKYEFSFVQELLESEQINFVYVVDKSSEELSRKENKEKIFITMDFARPQEFLPLMSLGNNVETLVEHAIINHSGIVGVILKSIKDKVVNEERAINPELTEDEILNLPTVTMYTKAINFVDEAKEIVTNVQNKDIGKDFNDDSKQEKVSSVLSEFVSLFETYPVLLTQILLGLYSADSYSQETLLSQQSPYLTQDELNIISSNIISPDFSEFVELQQTFNIDLQKELETKNIKEVEFVISRTLDLVEDDNIFSFTTMDVDSKTGVATIYISEAFLRLLDNSYSQEKSELLKQLALHEILEYLLLSDDTNLDYEKVHKQLEKYKNQKNLINVAQEIAPKILKTKEALFQEVDTLIAPCDFDYLDPKSTVGLLLGNRMVSSFTGTYQFYKKGKFSKIFISGNTRGTLDIVGRIRNNPENSNLMSDVMQVKDANAINTIKDLLSLSPDIFSTLTQDVIDSVVRDSSKIHFLNERLKTPISKDEIFDVVSKDGVSEAAVIKWVILETARQDGMNRKDINKLIKSVVLETKASNTPENIANIFAQKEFVDFVSDKTAIDIVIIQTPFSQTRASATLNKFLHANIDNIDLQEKKFSIYNMNFDINSVYYHYKTVSALTLSLGEWTRLIAYTLKGDVIPLIDQEEGIDAIPLEILTNLLNLLPLVNDKEKANLYKIFADIAKQNSDFESIDTLMPILKQHTGNENRYNLISDFIKYLYSDTAEQRQLQPEKALIDKNNVVDINIPQLMSEADSLERRMENTYQMLSAA